jgi:hypothetical protein
MHVIKTCYHWSTRTNKSPDCSRISHISSAFSSIQIALHHQTAYSQHIQFSLFFTQRLTTHKDKSTPKFQIPERNAQNRPRGLLFSAFEITNTSECSALILSGDSSPLTPKRIILSCWHSLQLQMTYHNTNLRLHKK